METTTETQTTETTQIIDASRSSTKAERWRKYDRDYKIVKYRTNEEFRQKTVQRALASYYRRKAATAVI